MHGTLRAKVVLWVPHKMFISSNDMLQWHNFAEKCWLDTNPKAIYVKNIWKNLHTYQVSLKACVHFFHQMIAIEKLWKRLYISSKNPFGSRDTLIFEIFSLYLDTSIFKRANWLP